MRESTDLAFDQVVADDLTLDVLGGADAGGLAELVGYADPLTAFLAAWALSVRNPE